MSSEAKKCRRCDLLKPLTEFYNSKNYKDGKRQQCKKCSDAVTLAWRERNPEKVTNQKIEWESKNSDKRKGSGVRNKEADKRNRDAWNARNPDKVSRDRYNWAQKKISTPKGRLERNVASAVRRSLRLGSKTGGRTFQILGYSVVELAAHLESLFVDGMDWSNQGKGGWHIDHIVPLDAFNFETPDHVDFKRAWALSNLQPLWEKDNCSKGAKLFKEFQPSLAIN